MYATPIHTPTGCCTPICRTPMHMGSPPGTPPIAVTPPPIESGSAKRIEEPRPQPHAFSIQDVDLASTFLQMCRDFSGKNKFDGKSMISFKESIALLLTRYFTNNYTVNQTDIASKSKMLGHVKATYPDYNSASCTIFKADLIMIRFTTTADSMLSFETMFNSAWRTQSQTDYSEVLIKFLNDIKKLSEIPELNDIRNRRIMFL